MESLEPRALLAADVIISEFMADNGGVILDVDGEASDWVELYNRGDAAQPMDGWYLTDSASQLTKWRIPNVTIQPGGTLLVWATSKNRTNPAAQLHTNFGLSRGGEFLGLVKPDGATIVTQFSPSFPSQFTNLSYGFSTDSTSANLVTHASPVQVRIPTDNSLGAAWTQTSFSTDGTWINGSAQAVGYDTATTYQSLIGTNVPAMRNANSSAYIRIPFTAGDSVDSLSLRIRYDDGFVAYINGQEVVRRNAPASVAWNSSAASDRIDSTAIQFETVNLSAHASLVNAGANVLAIHGLNVVPSSSDFLIDAELTGSSIQVRTDLAPRFFLTPTPGQPNIAGTLDTRPLITSVTNSAVTDTTDIAVRATVLPTGAAVAGVQLRYRVMYGSEAIVSMFDDGLHGDGASGDGVYGASIPAAASGPGQMIRWYVTASTAASATGRYPYFTDPNSTTQYLGSVIPDPNVTSALPIFQIFTPNPNWFRNSDGTINRNVASGSFFYDGSFYDNIQIEVRGQTSVQDAYPNQKFKISFNDDNRFDFGDGRDTLGSINLDNVYQDPSAARLTLGAWVFREAGAYAQLVEPVHTRMNGQFYSLGIFSERYNGPFLRRNDLGDEGALYESEGVFLGPDNLSPNAGNLATTAGMEKDNREWDPSFADLQALIDGISPSNPNRDRYIFDNVNIPEVVNVLAGYSLTKHYDRDTHNFYVYRDTDGNREWSLLPYDLDLIWDRLREPVFATTFTGHPFEGSSQDPTWAGTHWNRLIDAFADSPILSQMVVRRLRTLMDEILQPPGTPYAQRVLENRLDALAADVAPEAALDLARWGRRTGSAWGSTVSLAGGVAELKQAFNSRRNYLYGLSIIPGAQSAAPALTIGAIDVSPISGDQDQEFIQIVNSSGVAVDVSGWRVTGAVNFEFAKGVVIPARGSVYISPDVVAFRARSTGPRGGQGLFVQGPYSGNLSAAGETINLIRPDGSLSHTLTYGPVTAGPTLGPIAGQTIVSGSASAPIALAAADADTPTANLTFTGSAQSKLYALDQQLNLTAPTVSNYPYAYYQNIRGHNEKYLFNPSGVNPVNQWYYLLPNGDFYLFTGNPSTLTPASLQGTFLANLGSNVYLNPALLHNAQPQSIPITFQFATGPSPSFTITAAPGYQGLAVATVTVSDGSKTASRSFDVRASAPVTAGPTLGPIASQTIVSGSASAPIALAAADADTPTANLTFTGSAQSKLYVLDQQLNLTAPTVSNYPYAYYQNIRGHNEKYLFNPSGVNPVNQWYYLLPNGDFYLFTGNPSTLTPASLQGTFLANLGSNVYLNPALLHNAQPQSIPITFQFATGPAPSFTITAAPGYQGLAVATVTVSDGSKTASRSFDVRASAPVTAGPTLGPIAGQTIVSGSASAPIALAAADADTPTANLTFTGSAQSKLYVLDQQLNLTAPTVSNYPYAYYQNIRGHNEKYLFNPSGVNPVNQWYYLLPNGDFYLFTGNPSTLTSASLQGTFLANLGSNVYLNPALLHNAQPQSIPITFQFATGPAPSFTITAAPGYQGLAVATVTVSDGSKTASRSFDLHVNAPAAGSLLVAAPADFNDDGLVDGGDLAIWQTQFGLVRETLTFSGHRLADANGDGVVDGADMLLWQRNYGSVGILTSPAAVAALSDSESEASSDLLDGSLPESWAAGQPSGDARLRALDLAHADQGERPVRPTWRIAPRPNHAVGTDREKALLDFEFEAFEDAPTSPADWSDAPLEFESAITALAAKLN